MDCSPPGSSCPWDFPGKNTELGCHFLPQGAFPTQGLNPGLLHCRQILDHLSDQGSYCIGSITGLIWPMWESKHQASFVFFTQMVGSRDVTQNEPGSFENIPLKYHAVLCPHTRMIICV